VEDEEAIHIQIETLITFILFYVKTNMHVPVSIFKSFWSENFEISGIR